MKDCQGDWEQCEESDAWNQPSAGWSATEDDSLPSLSGGDMPTQEEKPDHSWAVEQVMPLIPRTSNNAMADFVQFLHPRGGNMLGELHRRGQEFEAAQERGEEWHPAPPSVGMEAYADPATRVMHELAKYGPDHPRWGHSTRKEWTLDDWTLDQPHNTAGPSLQQESDPRPHRWSSTTPWSAPQGENRYYTPFAANTRVEWDQDRRRHGNDSATDWQDAPLTDRSAKSAGLQPTDGWLLAVSRG